jgi:hypothetical protein
MGSSGALKIVKNRIGIRKLQSAKEWGQELKKKTIEHYPGQFPITQKIICKLLCCY